MRRLCVLGAVLATVGGSSAWSQATSPARGATLIGVIYDSLGSRPLSAANVQLVNAADPTRALSVITDSLGQYLIDSVPRGRHLLGFFHPILDSLGLSAPLKQVTIGVDGPVRVNMALPSARTLVTATCGAQSQSDSTGLVMGFVRSAGDGLPRPASGLSIRWSELVVTAEGVRRLSPGLDATTSEGGWFALCNVPLDAPVSVRAWNGADSSGAFELQIPPAGYLRRDVFVGAARRVRLTMADSAPGDSAPPLTTEVLRGPARLRGVVRGTNGTPVPGALVLLWGSGLEARASEAGEFAIDSLPAGTHTLEARGLGFLPARTPVDLFDDRLTSVSMELTSRGAFLDTIRVTSQRIYVSPQMQAFERRKRMGFGRFFDEDELEKRGATVVTDFLRMVPGITIAPSSRGMGGETVLVRGGGFSGGGYCSPTLFVDGMRIALDPESGLNINSIVSAFEVRALEVYSRGSNTPIEFQTLDGCGAIVVWTGGRRRTPEPTRERR